MKKYTFFASLLSAFVWMFPASITSQTAEFSVPKISVPAVVNIAEASAALPSYLTIPNAKVSTNIIEVGITKEGNLDVPNNYVEVGWYKYGPRPGEMGSAVLDGHVDDAKNTPGPFKHLRKLNVGDDIYVTMNNGKVYNYKVTVSEVHPTKKFPGEQVFHQNDQKYLKLITCHGKFVKSMGTYDERLIITAVLVE